MKWNREMAERHKGQQQQVPAQNRQEIQSHFQRGQSQDQIPVIDAKKEAKEDAEERWNQ